MCACVVLWYCVWSPHQEGLCSFSAAKIHRRKDKVGTDLFKSECYLLDFTSLLNRISIKTLSSLQSWMFFQNTKLEKKALLSSGTWDRNWVWRNRLQFLISSNGFFCCFFSFLSHFRKLFLLDATDLKSVLWGKSDLFLLNTLLTSWSFELQSVAMDVDWIVFEMQEVTTLCSWKPHTWKWTPALCTIPPAFQNKSPVN